MSVYDIDFEQEIRTLSQFGPIKAAELTIGAVGDYRSALFSNEATYVKGVVDRRAREFSTGRRVAREALARVGIASCEIPSVDRRPVWPASVTGSITHTQSLAAAIAGPRSRFVGLGIDLEKENAVSQKVSGRVLTKIEREWLPGPAWCSMLFACKEAVYKAVYPVIGEFLGFQDVELEVDVEDRKFRARCLQERDSSECVARGHGYWGLYRDHWLVVFVI